MEEKRCLGCMQLKNSPVCPHCGWNEDAPVAAHLLPPGTVLQGKYEIGRALGQGGFGITYLGWDQILEIPVAIKEYYPSGAVSRDNAVTTTVSLIRPDDNGEFEVNRSRFLREAQILAKLESVPEVVQVKNFFLENGTAYIIMGYVRGITLQRYIQQRGGRLSVEETFAILRPVIHAMDRVHKIGLVHRDISPDNIMLQPGGQPRLIDFGAAHKSSRESDMKSTQAVLKYGFAPMEQYQRRGNLGPWTDVYAICATAYYCLTGKTPPHATDRIMGEDEYDWNIPGLAPHQRHAMEDGVQLHVKDRTQSMEQLEQALFAPSVAPVPAPAPVYQPTPAYQPAPAYRPTPANESTPPSYTVPLVKDQEQAAYTMPVRGYYEPMSGSAAPRQPQVRYEPQPPKPEPRHTPAPQRAPKAMDLQSLIDRPVPQQKPSDFDTASLQHRESFWNRSKPTTKQNGGNLQDLINNPTPWKTTTSQPRQPEAAAPKPDLQSLIDNPSAYSVHKKRW